MDMSWIEKLEASHPDVVSKLVQSQKANAEKAIRLAALAKQMDKMEKQARDAIIEHWCENNLFGEREVEGIKISLTKTQKAIATICAWAIKAWEDDNPQ